MVIRFILRFLSNNEHLVQRLSESYPMRRAAQLVVMVFFRGKGIIEERQIYRNITPEQFRSIIQKFAQDIKREIQQAKEQFKKRN